MTLAANVLVQAAPALASPAPAKASKIGFQGEAFGTLVNVGNVVTSGRSALSTLGCTDMTGVTHTNSTAGVNVVGELTTGTINTSAASETTATPAGVAASSMTTIQNVNLLGGLVSATAVTSEATTSRDNATGAFSNSADGTQFLGLAIAGIPFTGTVGPNKTVTLPGVGYVIFNQQTGRIGPRSASLTVIAIHVVVTATNIPGVSAGTQIIVAAAKSGLGGPFNGLLSGLAFGASANVLGGAVILGDVFPQPLACFGTNGKTRTNGGALVNVPGLTISGTVADTAEGINNHKNSSAETSSTIENLNLLGVITATAVKADVTAKGSPPALGDNSTFLSLSINGMPYTGPTGPNTKIPLPGIGTLWLHKVITTSTSIRVIMIQLIVKAPSNPLGLTPGTTIDVASAKVGIS